MAAKAREHEAQVVQKLRGRAEGGVHAGDAGPLAQGEGRRYVQHLVHGGASGSAFANVAQLVEQRTRNA